MNKLCTVLYIAPRGLGILYICFLGIFALDVFSHAKPIHEVLISLLMHLIPNIIFLIALIFAWRYERIGGGAFFILGLFTTIFFSTYTSFINFMLISFPAFLVAALFLAHNVLGKKSRK